MAVEHIETVIQRLDSDHDFRRAYCHNPDQALQAYLSPEEIEAIKTGDGHKLHELGAGHKWEAITGALCGPHPGP